MGLLAPFGQSSVVSLGSYLESSMADADLATAEKCDRMEAFLQGSGGRPPKHRSLDPKESKLRKQWDDVVRRLTGPIGHGTKPSEQKLRQPHIARVETIQQKIFMFGQTQSFTADLPIGDGEAAGSDQTPTHQAEVQAPSSDETEPANKRLRTHPDSKAVTLSLRGLNIQWPFSQLLLLGAKLEEVRTYDLGYRQICNRDEEAWIVETKGPPTKAATNAIVGDLQIAPRPSAAQIVGTVSFADSYPYGYIYLCFGTGFLGGPWASIDSQAYCRACHGVI